jgi:hypothetical protein
MTGFFSRKASDKKELLSNEAIKQITNQCGAEADGALRCFLFRDKESGEKLAVDPEGYDYARYAAIVRT